ncbi:MAG TPA: hypothetical protein VN519_02225 [Bryobacteraceae bacterium]|nr:hypothetical protein [Bryobacteraceae bacterium]
MSQKRRHHHDLGYLAILFVLIAIGMSLVKPQKTIIVSAQPYSGAMANELQGQYYRGIFPGRDLTKRY